MRADWRGLAALLAAMTTWACGGSTPTTPSVGSIANPTTSAGVAPTLSTSSLERGRAVSAWVNFVGRPIAFSWDAVPGALLYTVDVGTSPGMADVFSASTTNLAVTTSFSTSGQVYPRVTAFTRNGGHASAGRVPLILFSFQDYVEAMFLGTGPLAQSPQSGCLAGTGRMAGWPGGAQVLVSLASSLSADQKRLARAAAAQAASATSGVFGATIRDSIDSHPTPGPSEIVVQQADPALPYPCSATALGCAVPLGFVSPGLFSRASILMNGASVRIGHEMGHALYGFCHLTTDAGYVSIMGNFDDDGRGLAEADLAATRAVYQAGLRGGAMRGDFVAAGLVTP